jgi:hypothetical protein
VTNTQQLNSEPTPRPDPGNAGPERWTEELPPAELAEVAKRLQDEFGGDS